MSFGYLLFNSTKSGSSPRSVPSVYNQLMEPGRGSDWIPPSPVRDENSRLRMSSLAYSCPRQEALRIVHNVDVRRDVTARDTWVFDLGSAHHWMMQSIVVPRLLRSRMRGWWRSPAGMFFGGYVRGRPELLESPGDEFEYVEITMDDPILGLTGHSDMILDWSGSGIPGVPDGLEVQEYKTKNADNWRFIDPAQGGEPDEAHVDQIIGYMYIIGAQHGRIVYILKGENDHTVALVEWTVQMTDRLLESIKRKAADHWAGIAAGHRGEVPHEKTCSSFQTRRANDCAVRYECFGKGARKERVDIRPSTVVKT